jgi:amino acid permease
MALQTTLKLRAIQQKAKSNNIEFVPLNYFKDDWLSLTASLLTIILTLFFVSEILEWKSVVINYVKIGFAFVGYTGSDIMSRLFGVVNNKINSAIDYKTTIADQATGTTDKPTPAT